MTLLFIGLSAVLTLTIVILVIVWDSSRYLGRYANAIFSRFPRTGSFAFGALFGFYAGLGPAFIVYAIAHRPWAAELVDGAVALACGFGWAKVGERPRGKKRPVPNTQKGSVS
jgi:hypothetical protein